MQPDVIVVGAGTAGCVVARRLIDAGRSVLLLEAGSDNNSTPQITDPSRMHELWDTGVDWGFRTVPQKHAHDRELHLPRGKVVGGSHALNGMIWVRGHPTDYDSWGPGWSWAEVKPVFERIESVQDVITAYDRHPVHESIVDAAMQNGLPFNENYNGDSQDGVSFVQLTIRDGKRLTTAQAYLDPVRDDPRLRVVCSARVHRLLMSGSRCVGVEWDRGGVVSRASAAEVVLCAGAIGSPVILQRSGIGDPALLGALDIAVTAPIPDVGSNLQDHWLVPVVFATVRPVAIPAGLPTCQSHLFWRSRPELTVPDLQPIHFATALVSPWMASPAHGITLMAGLIRPESHGTVRIASADPGRAPLIDPRVLSAKADLDALTAAVDLCREVGAQPALREGWGARELYPASMAATPELTRDYIRETVVTYHHQVGTCAIGQVVDPCLRVHGIDQLTVADASVMPIVPTGNTNAPAAMVGERAAGFLTVGTAA
ncbi:GMC family oxidoreductase [Kibdelosporangium phytohabitans]|uniref:Oxidoreductase n=1 Tax=Kibdelosporangium phytohabitans TaxID=860235 RepID=A0A0N9I575_9PSEU|nr:GMC family oxidoreductase N-terminal domain-containing protein [Kibdelosporangium phytohabitans]ALG10788.1 oxidoreductase [Kibdelosporangium phytohabitans]MBE1461949.1 choline dehydrogenase [Kibdelosporangium phytohabitans]